MHRPQRQPRPLAPAAEGIDRWSAWLNISLNGQQYESGLSAGRLPPGTAPGFRAGAGGFALYANPQPLEHASPPIARGGQQVVVYSAEIRGGCAYACRFGASADDPQAPGNYDPRRGALRCTAPTRPAGSWAEVWVSLNGQQFVRSGANVTWV